MQRTPVAVDNANQGAPPRRTADVFPLVPRLRGAVPGVAKRALRTMFELGQRVGLDVTPRHFYSQVPDIRGLRASDGWRTPSSLTGVRGTDVDAQLDWLRAVCTADLAAELRSTDLWSRAAKANGAVGYGPVESELLYCLVRTHRPRRILQIGAGASTWVVQAAALDEGIEVDLRCVDPFPTPFLREQAAAGTIALRSVPVQDVPADDLAAELGPGDVLFVDSTHTVSPGSDVNHLVLEVLPRLREGVLVHFHDITLPYDFSPTVLSSDLFFWNESVLLHAYLADNPRMTIRYGGAMLHEYRRADAQAILPAYARALPTDRGLAGEGAEGAYPSSMWLEVVGPPSAA